MEALSLFAEPGTPALATPSVPGRLVSGRERAAERFALEVLTPRGALRFLRDRGTRFLELTGSARALSEADAYAALAAAALDALPALQAEESAADDDATRVVGGRAVAVTVTAAGSAVSVIVYTRAGTAARHTVALAGEIPDGRAVFHPD